MTGGKGFRPSMRKHQTGGRGEKKQPQPALGGAEERRTQDVGLVFELKAKLITMGNNLFAG
jgi:hypothetical protein